MNCPKCDIKLIEGATTREPDGTEYRCLKCKSRFGDLKIPYDALLSQEAGRRGV